MLKLMEKSKREDVQRPLGTLGSWIKLNAPSLIDKIALRTITEGK
jgi:hypothetical protein